MSRTSASSSVTGSWASSAREIRTPGKVGGWLSVGCYRASSAGPRLLAHRSGCLGFANRPLSIREAPWLVATSTHARHITSRRVSLS